MDGDSEDFDDGPADIALENILVARNIPAAELIMGRELAVLFFDEFRASDAVVAAVW